MNIISVVLVLAIGSIWIPMPLIVRVSMSLVMVVALIVSWIAMRQHNRGWCSGCITPLDPNEAARRNHRSLSIVHLAMDVKMVIFWYVAMLGLYTWMVLIMPGVITGISWSLANLTLVYVLRASVIHQRLQPWCPACRKGGTSRVDSSEPLPVDGLTV